MSRAERRFGYNETETFSAAREAKGKLNRRALLRNLTGVVAAIATAGTVAGVVTKLAVDREKSSGRFNGQPIDGMEPGTYRTETFSNGEEIPLRAEPKQARQVGIALENFNVEAQPVYGTQYSTNVGNLRVEKEGEIYGVWYKVKEVPIWAKADNGQWVPIGVAKDAFVSGNFLTKVEDESDNQSDAR